MRFPDLKYPIIQAPIGSLATTDLVAAVSNAGAMGSLALTWTEPEIAADRINRLKLKTSQPFLVNFVLAFPTKSLNAALNAGAPIVSFSWGQPGQLINTVHQHNALVGVQVGTADGAKQALDQGADFIICQGVEAGGHVQSTTPLSELLASVNEIARQVPVIAAGGLSTSEDVHWAIEHGAKASMMGTRFIATVESRAHTKYKQALVDSKTTDSVYTMCFDGNWPYAAHRVLRNRTLTDWENAGCPQPGQRPNENQLLASDDTDAKICRYDDDPPLVNMKGDILDCCLYAGTGCGSIKTIPHAAGLLTELWTD